MNVTDFLYFIAVLLFTSFFTYAHHKMPWTSKIRALTYLFMKFGFYSLWFLLIYFGVRLFL